MPSVEEAPPVVLDDSQKQLDGLSAKRRGWLEKDRAGVAVEDSDHATRPKDPAHFFHRLQGIAQVLEHVVSEGGIERRVGERKRVDVAALETQVGDTATPGQLARVLELNLGNVDADDLARSDGVG